MNTIPTARLRVAPRSALAALGSVPTKGRAPKTGYSREEFGQAWADVDHNGCDTRNDMLRRDLTRLTFRNARDCVVLRGTLHDPYSGSTVQFTRGVTTSSRVQIDHVVPLYDAWQKGAQSLSRSTRTALANDPLNLIPVMGAENEQKSSSDAASWLPTLRSFRCQYVARQVAVKVKYHLWVTRAERSAIAGILQRC